MSIESEINRIKSNISSAYSAVKSKGGTVPVEKTSANLPTAIRAIPQEGGGVDVEVIENSTDPDRYEPNGLMVVVGLGVPLELPPDTIEILDGPVIPIDPEIDGIPYTPELVTISTAMEESDNAENETL